MQECKPVKVPILVGVKLSADQCPRHMKKRRTCLMFHMQVKLAV
jgi:hypothetical protein